MFQARDLHIINNLDQNQTEYRRGSERDLSRKHLQKPVVMRLKLKIKLEILDKTISKVCQVEHKLNKCVIHFYNRRGNVITFFL